MAHFTLQLPAPATEMVQEEISKQAVFLSKDIARVAFEDARTLGFDAPSDSGPELLPKVRELAERIQRGLRRLERKVLFRSSAMESPRFQGGPVAPGFRLLGPGQVSLAGVYLRLFRYFDRIFEQMGEPFGAKPIMVPTLIPTRVLAACDYFRSFPQYVTFACHLPEEVERVSGFRARHEQAEDLDDQALADMQKPEACLSPAVCYHIYHLKRDQVVPAAGSAYGMCGRCFRYESGNLSDLRRLWDFTMREIVLLGGREYVLEQRERSISLMSKLIEEHQLAGEIRTASDPFFLAPDTVSKTYFQLSSDTKFEISLLLPDGERLAVGSHNYHSDFFGKVFNVGIDGGGPMHSVCVAFGLERWVHAFLAQHGHAPAEWPACVRQAPEFLGAESSW